MTNVGGAADLDSGFDIKLILNALITARREERIN